MVSLKMFAVIFKRRQKYLKSHKGLTRFRNADSEPTRKGVGGERVAHCSVFAEFAIRRALTGPTTCAIHIS